MMASVGGGGEASPMLGSSAAMSLHKGPKLVGAAISPQQVPGPHPIFLPSSAGHVLTPALSQCRPGSAQALRPC